MTDVASIDSADRLPWLSDKPATPPARSGRKGRSWTLRNLRELAGWAVAALLAVAGTSYWLGTTYDGDGGSQRIAPPHEPVRGTMLALPTPNDTSPEVSLPPAPEINPAPAPQVAIDLPTSPKSTASRQRPQISRERPSHKRVERVAADQSSGPAKAISVVRTATASTAQQPLTLWPSRQVKGAAGRLVQIGAFATRQQAKLGWRQMQRAYPAMGRLPAVVVDARNSKGRKFYRFQIGTTSQAHSEVICQRMQKINFSCAVLGLPWKAKVER